jgi:hypothetical protein
MSDESSDNDNEINDDDDDASANNGNTIAEDGIAEIANDDDDDDDGRRRRQATNVGNEEERWNNAIECDLGDGVVLQMVGLESPTGTVFARLIICQASDTCSPDVMVRRVVQVIIQEREELQQETTEELFRLGAIWSLDTHHPDDSSKQQREKKSRWQRVMTDCYRPTNWAKCTLRVHCRPA